MPARTPRVWDLGARRLCWDAVREARGCLDLDRDGGAAFRDHEGHVVTALDGPESSLACILTLRGRIYRPGYPAEPRTVGLFAGLRGSMFWLRRSTFLGSYFLLISTRRA